MPPSLALLLWSVLIVGLIRFDPARPKKLSLALWIPCAELFFTASRLPSMWLGGNSGFAAQALEEGNSLDRSVRLALMIAAVAILFGRSFDLQRFLARNAALVAVLGFGALSVLWSDFPLVAFKRWIRDLGTYFAILVVLTDAQPVDAMRTLFRRLLYVLLSLSVLLIKYFPEMGKGYDSWTGMAYFSGAGTSKNMLGLLCLAGGLFFIWDLLTRWRERGRAGSGKIIAVDVMFLGMTLWLLQLADSATSRACLALGSAILLLSSMRWLRRSPAVVTASIGVGVVLATVLTLAWGPDLTGEVAKALGRDPTLTDRTVIWSVLLGMGTNPVLGTGYESFWLGPRLQWIWERGYGQINQAHNGYLQVYLNLGLSGLALVLVFLASGYRKISGQLSAPTGFASLGLAVWVVLLFYNITEAALLGGLLWTMLLPAVLTVESGERRARPVAPRLHQRAADATGMALSAARSSRKSCR